VATSAKEVSVRPNPVVFLSIVALAAGASAAEVTRTLKARLSGADLARYGVENLAGSMRVAVGSEDGVEAVATIHAESAELADLVRFERVIGDKDAPTLRVRYPVERYSEYRYPGGSDDGGLLFGLFPWGSADTKYDGHRVYVSARKGVLLYADVEVHVPRRSPSALFRNAVGPIDGSGVAGSLRFDTGQGKVTVAEVGGDVVADTGSGDVDAKDVNGSFKCDTGSGECLVTGFSGERLVCDTGSGRVRVTGATARSVDVDSGSGSVTLDAVDADEVKIDTGSGSLDMTSPSKRLTRLKADTGSGSVTLRLAADAGFEARADLGSGRIDNRFADAQAIRDSDDIVGYRRGDGRIRIDVDTGSGGLVLEPAR
jgi:lia operon protein LiaG